MHDHGHGRAHAEGNVAMDRVDARLRLVSMALWVGIVVTLRDADALGVILLAAIACSVVLGAGAGRLLARIGPLTLALVPAWVVLPLSGPGPEALGLGPLSIREPGLMAASLLQARAAAALSVVVLHEGLSPWSRWVWALGKLGAPSSLLGLMTVTLRYLPILDTESKRTMTAARARGFKPGSGAEGYADLAAILGSGLVRSYRRSERVVRAMEARGYTCRFFPLDESPSPGANLVFLLLSALAASIMGVHAFTGLL